VIHRAGVIADITASIAPHEQRKWGSNTRFVVIARIHHVLGVVASPTFRGEYRLDVTGKEGSGRAFRRGVCAPGLLPRSRIPFRDGIHGSRRRSTIAARADGGGDYDEDAEEARRSMNRWGSMRPARPSRVSLRPIGYHPVQ
jgi:hypothetical protein